MSGRASASLDAGRLPAGPVRVRPCVAADWPALKQVRLAALLDAPQAFGVSHAEALANPDSQWQARAAATGPARFFLAGQAGAADADADADVDPDPDAIGMVAAVALDEGGPGGSSGPGGAGEAGRGGRLGLIAMWVSRPLRGIAVAGGGRVADLLIEAVQAHAVAVGARTLTLEVAPDNHRAVALYARHGFRFDAHVEALASDPTVKVQRMAWTVPAPAGALSR